VCRRRGSSREYLSGDVLENRRSHSIERHSGIRHQSPHLLVSEKDHSDDNQREGTSAVKRCNTWRGKQTVICPNFVRMIVLEIASMWSNFIPPITN